MAKSLIYVVNAGTQSVAAGGTVSLGSVIRRFGCGFALSGNGIRVGGQGYYALTCNIVAEPAAIGSITATLYKDGVAIPGATASAYASTADTPVTLPIVGVIREGCCCSENTSTITCVINAEASITNVAFKGEKL